MWETTPVEAIGIMDATSIAAGYGNACAVLSGGEARCWGFGTYGQLGSGDTYRRAEPIAVAGLDDAVSVAASYWHTCAVRSSGAAACWGRNVSGQRGDGDPSSSGPIPVEVSGSEGTVSIMAEGNFSCAVLGGGGTRCWGKDVQGQLGNGSGSSDATEPVGVKPVAG